MKRLLTVKCAILSFFVVISSLNANENQNAAENVIRRAYTSIDRIEDGKIFFEPEKVCLMKGKIYVEDIGGAGVAIPAVFSSEGGLYMQVDESIIFNTWKCNCGAWNHNWDNPNYCWRCDQPR